MKWSIDSILYALICGLAVLGIGGRQFAVGAQKPGDSGTTSQKHADAAGNASAKDNSATSTGNHMGKFDIQSKDWGKLPDGREAKLYTVTNPNGLKLSMSDYGATIISLEVPDKNGKLGDIVLGAPTPA